jgi:dihydrofolate reductase
MGTVIMHNAVSVDGFIADAQDQVGPLFDWYANGDVELVEGGTLKVSRASAAYARPMLASIGAMVIGRHLFDITNGWEGSPPAGGHVIVVSHRPRPDGWHPQGSHAVHPRPQASYYFIDDVAQAIAKARKLAGDRAVAAAARTIRDVRQASLRQHGRQLSTRAEAGPLSAKDKADGGYGHDDERSLTSGGISMRYFSTVTAAALSSVPCSTRRRTRTSRWSVRGPDRDNGPMRDQWMHVGRLWTDGGPFLAVDAALRGAWHGLSNDDYDQVVALGWQDTSIPVGTGRAVLVGGDGAVRDDSWVEVFEAETDVIAIVQASGSDYPDALARALDYPVVDDQDGDALKVDSGELAVFNAALDGAGPHSGPWVTARPGPAPPVHGPPSRAGTDPSLLISTSHTAYKLKVRWYTKLDDGSCFARWLLIPIPANC